MATAPLTKEAIESQPGPRTTVAVARPAMASEPQDAGENLYLIGRPTLKDFLRYVKSHAVNPPSSGDLAEEWKAASEVIGNLEKDEAGCADNPRIEPLTPDNQLLLEFLKDPIVRHSFNTVPTEVAYVDLNQMVVYQRHIDLTFVRQLQSKLGPAPTEEEIFRTCLPHGQPQHPPVKWSRMHGDTYVFLSPSNDLRFLGVMPLEPRHITDYPPPGNMVGVVGLAVGFGSNFLNAIYAEKRLILNNGSHRAYALREMGITHVPCIVQHISSRDELDVLAATAVTDTPNLYLQGPRPMMLKDYFHPKLRKVMAVHRRLRQIRVKFEIDQASLPAL